MSDNYGIWLCYSYMQLDSHYEVRAIYNNETEAEAWLAGVKASDATGRLMCVDANEGPIDFYAWMKEAGEQ